MSEESQEFETYDSWNDWRYNKESKNELKTLKEILKYTDDNHFEQDLKTEAVKWGKNMIKKYGNCFEVEDFFKFFDLDLKDYLYSDEDLK